MTRDEFPSALLDALRKSQRVTVLTGAGISAESGVPTFRDAQTGLWASYQPGELATPEAFQRNPRLVWEWYEWRRSLIKQAVPNPAHYALVEIERRVPIFHLVTQNVDGLHKLAGSQGIIELHGNIHRYQCSREGIVIEKWQDTGEVPPRCPHCGAWIRPAVVWFGESLPQQALELAWEAAEKSDLFFAIGTSGIVHPAASLPHTARSNGALVVEINPDETPLSAQVNFRLRGAAGVVLPALVRATWQST